MVSHKCQLHLAMVLSCWLNINLSVAVKVFCGWGLHLQSIDQVIMWVGLIQSVKGPKIKF